jgi:hypothetical protein
MIWKRVLRKEISYAIIFNKNRGWTMSIPGSMQRQQIVEGIEANFK